MKRSDERLSLTYFFSDLLALNSVLLLSLNLYQGDIELHYDGLTMLALSLIWIMCASVGKVYYLNQHSSFRLRMKNYLKSHFAFVGAVSTLYMIFSLPNYFKTVMILFVVAFPLLNLFTNFVLFKALGKLRAGEKNVRRALIVGAGRSGAEVLKHFQSNPDIGYKVIGFLEDSPSTAIVRNNILGGLDDLDNVLETTAIDEVVIAISTVHFEKIRKILDRVDYHGIRAKVLPDYSKLFGNNYTVSRIGDMPLVNVREISLDTLSLSAFKRIFDIAFAGFAMLMLAPLFITLATLIKLDSPGPVFYCPTRVGRGGKRFKVYKFRSMYQGDNSGTQSTQKDDKRVTKIGKVLRKYSLDELPQFLNVLSGEMSVVGPRPHRVFLNNLMQKEVDRYMLRQYLKPGITGWAQVNGWRGPTDTEEQRNQRTAHDLWYLENWSLALDLKIVYLTVFSEKTHQVAF